MKRKIWISTVAGAILVLGTAANMSDNPSQSPSDDSVVINDWLIVGDSSPFSVFTPTEGSLMATGGVMVGPWCRANGYASLALGDASTANADYSVATGLFTTTNGEFSVATVSYTHLTLPTICSV